MLRMQLIALIIVAMPLGSACGSSQPGGTASGSDATGAPDPGQEGTAGGDNEFQLSDSDTAEQAHGERPSEIEATETEAAMRLFVVDPETGPIEGIVIKMTAPNGAAYFTKETDSHGYAEVLVPVGQRYEMEYLTLGRRNTTANVEVPEGPNQDIRLTLRYRRWRPSPESDAPEAPEGEQAEPEPQRFVLDGVQFDSGRATIRSESYPRLDRIVEYMTHKQEARIRIAGHTDNTGNARANQRLSEQRAQAVREYLVENGIDGDRVEAVGYGDEQPVASNDTEEGRAQNRRIEAIEL